MQQIYLEAVRCEQVQADWNTSECGAITFGKQGERETISRRGAFMRIRWLARREASCCQTVFSIGFRMRAYTW